MRRFVTVGFAATLMLGLTGCGGGADAVLKEQISLLNQAADALTAKDQAKYKDLMAKVAENGQQLSKFSPDELKSAMEKHGKDLVAAQMKIGMAGAGQFGDMLKQGMGDMMKGAGDMLKGVGGGGLPKINFP